jgi:hypothetical protein
MTKAAIFEAAARVSLSPPVSPDASNAGLREASVL